MEILATVGLTLLFIVLILMIIAAFLTFRELGRCQQMHADLAKFMESMGNLLQDAAGVIEAKKREIGFDVEEQ